MQQDDILATTPPTDTYRAYEQPLSVHNQKYALRHGYTFDQAFQLWRNRHGILLQDPSDLQWAEATADDCCR